MIVVSNARALLVLAQADSLHLLKALFAQILTPGAIYRETVDQSPVPIQKQRIQSATDDFISVTVRRLAYRFSRSLGEGEQGVLRVAIEQEADLILMDDKQARNEATKTGFRCAYTTDLLRFAEQQGIIDSASAIVERLKEARIFLPDRRGEDWGFPMIPLLDTG